MDLSAKVKTAAEVLGIIGTAPREKKVALGHGCYDLLHVGHIRHLDYAKSKADILIVSLTADEHIAKGPYRPEFPQDLRAMHLAALGMVDYVIIDSNPDPLQNIRLLKPDFFVKGHDYADMGSAKTAEEAAAVAEYGGEVMFTPGDLVSSSTRLLQRDLPGLRYEKLVAVMKRGAVTFHDLRAALEKMADFRVHVVGDLIVDTITETTKIGGMTKTPTISVKKDREINFVGGAGIVAKHLKAAGAKVLFTTVTGDDDIGRMAVEDMILGGVRVVGVIDNTRPTTRKNAITADGYRLLKVDDVDNRQIDDSVLEELASYLRDADSDAVVFSDFRHGIFTKSTIPGLTAGIRSAFRVADSQVASRWGNITDFRRFDLVTPNEHEARFALGDQESGVRSLASQIRARSDASAAILKLGDRGVMGCSREEVGSFLSLDSFTEECVDPVGAGDALLAYATLAMLASGRNLPIACILGSIAAALECERDGNIPITSFEVFERLNKIERVCNYG